MGRDAISVVSALLEAGSVDTVYRDVYLERPRTLLSAEALKQAVTGDSKLVEAAGCPRPALSASSLAPGV
jgi:hypothetical protein